MCPFFCPRFRTAARKSVRQKEAPVGIEPTNRGFADLCLTTWLRRRWKGKVARRLLFCKAVDLFPSKNNCGGGRNGGTGRGRVQPLVQSATRCSMPDSSPDDRCLNVRRN